MKQKTKLSLSQSNRVLPYTEMLGAGNSHTADRQTQAH